MSKDRQVDEPSLLDGAEINLRLKGDGWVATIRVGDQQRAGHGSTAPIALIDMAMDLRTWIKSRNA